MFVRHVCQSFMYIVNTCCFRVAAKWISFKQDKILTILDHLMVVKVIQILEVIAIHLNIVSRVQCLRRWIQYKNTIILLKIKSWTYYNNLKEYWVNICQSKCVLNSMHHCISIYLCHSNYEGKNSVLSNEVNYFEGQFSHKWWLFYVKIQLKN